MPARAAAPAAERTRAFHPRSSVAALALLVLLLAAALVASVAIGAADLSLREVAAALAGRGDETARAIVRDLRLPRAMLAAMTGASLALAGAVFQALLRNPLADPYVLGVSGGAAVGAVAAIVLGLAARAPWSVPAAALAGALAAIFIVFRIASAVGRALDTRVLLLSGVVVGAFFNAVILLLLALAEAESFRSAVFWMMGSLSSASWAGAALLAAHLAPAILVLLGLARPLDLLAVGEETALHLGVRAERVKLAAYFVASLLVAASVAACGVIGFIGLIVPHALRLAWGSSHRLLLPASVLAGAAFLLVADTAARTIAAPAELPVGVITALIGVPIFVLLLARRKA
jgi:iron complex transport system permease protein